MEYAVVSLHDLPGILQPARAIVITNKACNMGEKVQTILHVSEMG